MVFERNDHVSIFFKYRNKSPGGGLEIDLNSSVSAPWTFGSTQIGDNSVR